MNRNEASAAIATGALTFGALRSRLRNQPRHDGLSVLNPGITQRESLDILARGIATRGDVERVSQDSSRDSMIAMNILRETS